MPVDGGDILVRVLTPSENPRGVLVYYHGGGWVIGDVPSTTSSAGRLANRPGRRRLLVDYRKAPEHRYPAAARTVGRPAVGRRPHLHLAPGGRRR